MPHPPWHQLPQYGSPGFGSAVGQALQAQATPGLLTPPYPEPPGPQLPPMQAGASPRQTGFSGPIEWDVMDMDPTAGVQNELVEPLQEKAPGRQLDWDVLTQAGMGLGGFQAPSANLGFSQQAIQNNPSPYEWDQWQRMARGERI